MIVIGLTGSIGMGKSTIARQLESLGAKICNADDIVHTLMAKGGIAVPDIASQFPGVVENGAVNRKKLGDIVFNDKGKLTLLERILHPLVAAAELAFIARERAKGTAFVVMDIPLLFETDAYTRCDLTLVVTAPYFLQSQRVLRRAGMSEQKFQHILRSQMPDREKRKRADFVVQTGLGKAHSFKQCRMLACALNHEPSGSFHETRNRPRYRNHRA